MPVVVGLLNALGLVLLVMLVGSMTAAYRQDGELVEAGYQGSALVAMRLGTMLTLPFWIPTAVIVALSRLWAPGHQLMLAALLPVSVVVMALLPTVGWAVGGIDALNGFTWFAVAIVLGGGSWLLWKVVGAGLARARELAPPR